MRMQRQEEPTQMGPKVSITNEVLPEMDLKRWGRRGERGQGRSSFQVDDQEIRRKTKTTIKNQ